MENKKFVEVKPGSRFGTMTVIDQCKITINNCRDSYQAAAVNLKCDCGNIVSRRIVELKDIKYCSKKCLFAIEKLGIIRKHSHTHNYRQKFYKYNSLYYDFEMESAMIDDNHIPHIDVDYYL